MSNQSNPSNPSNQSNQSNQEQANLENRVTQQPMTPQEVDPQQKQAQKAELEREGNHLTANPGDRIDESKSLQEKAQQVAVDAPDIAGEHIVVPTYFVVDEPDGSQKALHHVKDAEEISDMIRQARMDENGNRIWS
ncbi:MAG: hypothetical protein MUF72_03860 [Elainella sp. Prado103]|jgi:hypothetical protein|nr:hypothetical protein [Elainella sp. Prado103]